jgi:hypothetical protein
MDLNALFSTYYLLELLKGSHLKSQDISIPEVLLLQGPLFLMIANLKCVLSSLHVAKLGVWMEKIEKILKVHGSLTSIGFSDVVVPPHVHLNVASLIALIPCTLVHVHHRFIGLAVVSSTVKASNSQCSSLTFASVNYLQSKSSH